MSYKSEESKVFNSLTDSQQSLLRCRTSLKIKDMHAYINDNE